MLVLLKKRRQIAQRNAKNKVNTKKRWRSDEFFGNFLKTALIMRQSFYTLSVKIHIKKEREDFMDVKMTLNEKKAGVGAFALRQATFAMVGYLLSRGSLPLGATPFGFAALCAVSTVDVLGATLGIALGAIGNGSAWTTIGAYAVTLIVRVLFSLTEGKGTPIFGEHLSLRIVAASAGAFSLGLYKLISGDFIYYYLWGTIISILTAALGAFLWYALANGNDFKGAKKKRGYSLWWNTAVVGAVCVVVWGLRGITLYTVSLSAFACLLATLFFARRQGISFGAVLGAAAGLCVSVAYAPLFAFGAVCFGLIYSFSPLAALLSVFAVGMAWGVYIDGVTAISALLPALMAGCFLFFVFDKLYGTNTDIKENGSEVEEKQELMAVSPTDVALLKLDSSARRIKLLCEGFSSLSRTLSLGECATENPLSEDFFAEIGEIGQSFDGTRSSDYASYMCQTLRTDIPSLDYAAVADYLAGVISEGDCDVDERLSKRISRMLTEKYPEEEMRAIAFFGTDGKIAVLGRNTHTLKKAEREICELVGDVCACRMYCRDTEDFEGQAYMTIYRSPALDVSFAGRKMNAPDELDFCGDSFGIISRYDDGKMFSFISDGMGSGREAAVTSGLCALFLQKLLPTAVSSDAAVGVTLNMLNGFLRSRNTCGVLECASTIDLCRLDLVRCRADFYKCGAAPTYIFRDGSLFKLRSRTVPIGIVNDVDVGRIDMELCPNDVIVMVSDGVTQGREESPELFDYLRARILTHSAQQLADAVIDFAKQQGREDDVSVVVMKIEDTVGKRK